MSISPSEIHEDKQLGKCFCIRFPYGWRNPCFLSNIFFKSQQQRHEDRDLKRGNTPLVLLEDLKPRTHLVDTMQIKYTMKDIILQRRLILVLDLDNTLLHSSPSYNRQVDARIRNHYCQYNSRKETSADLFVLNNLALVTKLRPHARAFLEALHPFYDMYVYTMRNRTYAATMARLLDPQGCFIGSKVISCEDSTIRGTKALDVLSGPIEAIVIVDDTMDVWRRNKDQERIINIFRYYYSGFRGVGSSKGKEEEEDTALLNVLAILKRIHSGFFSSYSNNDQHRMQQELRDGQNIGTSNNSDVSVLLRNMQSCILCGCCIVFSGIFPVAEKAAVQAAWVLAERLGASCLTELDADKVTHIIARYHDAPEARWAITNGKFLVTPSWLDEAFYSWTRPVEEKFQVQHARRSALIKKR